MSKRAHRFPSFSITTSLHLKSTSALMLSSGLTQATHKRKQAIFIFHTRTTHACQLPVPTLPAHLLSSSARPPLSLSLSLCHSFQTRCYFFEYIFGPINSWCSASQLFLALTQTGAIWRLLLLLLFVRRELLVIILTATEAA
ncbi:unnamed protein product [Hymenolepis diminuta]|uniref:Uncharacterized protein n=1 Tax=Hymenolepis diminuta TaxID=6216 RepID=A0A564Y112_HYMDI|nr:unnamed protein product [Hymenolepis diminuta]